MNKGTEKLTLNFPQGLAGPLASSQATESQPSMPGAEQHGDTEQMTDDSDQSPVDTEQRLVKKPVQVTNNCHGSTKLMIYRQKSWTVTTPDDLDGRDQNVVQKVFAVTVYHGKLAIDSDDIRTQPVKVTTPALSTRNSCEEYNDMYCENPGCRPCVQQTNEHSPRMLGSLQEMSFDDLPTTAEQGPANTLPVQADNNSGPAQLVSGQRKSWNVNIVDDPGALGNNVAEHVLFGSQTNVYYTPSGDNKLPH